MTQSFNHQFKGFGRVPSECSVMIFSDDGENLICFEDLNIGTSVTNASEQLATEIVEMLELNPNDCRFFETYTNTSFDEITYTWIYGRGRWEAKDPDWRPVGEDEINQLFMS